MTENWSDEEYETLSGKIRPHRINEEAVEKMRERFWLRFLKAEQE